VVPPFFNFQQKFNLRSAQKINAPKKPKKKDENDTKPKNEDIYILLFVVRN
jgi:hypothetical protein